MPRLLSAKIDYLRLFQQVSNTEHSSLVNKTTYTICIYFSNLNMISQHVEELCMIVGSAACLNFLLFKENLRYLLLCTVCSRSYQNLISR